MYAYAELWVKELLLQGFSIEIWNYLLFIKVADD